MRACTRSGRSRASSCRAQSPSADLFRALNAKLPEDVRVLSAEVAAPGFNARFSARSKMYRYRISNTRVMSPFQRRFAWHISRTLDLAAMTRGGARAAGRARFRLVSGEAPSRASEMRRRRTEELHAHHDPLRHGPKSRSPGGGRLLIYEIAGTRLPEIHGARDRRHARRGRRRAADRRVAPRFARIEKPRRGGPDGAPSGLYLVRVDYDAAAPVSFLIARRAGRWGPARTGAGGSATCLSNSFWKRFPRISRRKPRPRGEFRRAAVAYRHHHGRQRPMGGAAPSAARRRTSRRHRVGARRRRDVGPPRHRRAHAVRVFGRELEAPRHRSDRVDDAAEALSASRARRHQPQQHPLPRHRSHRRAVRRRAAGARGRPGSDGAQYRHALQHRAQLRRARGNRRRRAPRDSGGRARRKISTSGSSPSSSTPPASPIPIC